MFFGGGFPFGFAQPHQEEDHEQEDNDQPEGPYEILQVESDATPEQLKTKFEELTVKHSPNGPEPDQQKYRDVNDAYELLSDPQKRKLYDASQSKGMGGDMFNMMFGGGHPGQHSNQKPKMQPTKKQLQVTLQQIYTGAVISHHHQRARLCEACDGKGGENVKKCPICKGQGGVVQMMQMGPGMYQQVEKDCDNCQATGDLFEQGKKCVTCEGKKIAKKEVDLQVKIQKGIPSSHIITLEGEGNEVPSAKAGDLIFITVEQPHQVYTRKGADLFMKKTISLIEALLGFNFKLKHLDGKEYTIYTEQGEIVGDHDKKIVKNLGMPFFKDQEIFGNLIIQFKVQMPKRAQLTPKQLEVLKAVLPGEPHPRPKDQHYEMMEDFDKEQVNSSEEGGKKKDEEEEEQGQQGGIGCQAQ